MAFKLPDDKKEEFIQLFNDIVEAKTTLWDRERDLEVLLNHEINNIEDVIEPYAVTDGSISEEDVDEVIEEMDLSPINDEEEDDSDGDSESDD